MDRLQWYELLHPFSDANTRTLTVVLSNFLLMQNGLRPAAYYDPNVFYFLSDDELVVKIKEGQAASKAVLKGPIYDFDSNDIPEENKKKFKTWCATLRATLEKCLGITNDAAHPLGKNRLKLFDHAPLTKEEMSKKTESKLIADQYEKEWRIIKEAAAFHDVINKLQNRLFVSNGLIDEIEKEIKGVEGVSVEAIFNDSNTVFELPAELAGNSKLLRLIEKVTEIGEFQSLVKSVDELPSLSPEKKIEVLKEGLVILAQTLGSDERNLLFGIDNILKQADENIAKHAKVFKQEREAIIKNVSQDASTNPSAKNRI